MQITTEIFGNVLVAHTPDELTDDTSDDFVNSLSDAINQQHYQVVLQMDRSEVLDSAGLTALLDLQDLTREKGGNLKISGLEEPGKKILEMTRLDQRIDIFDSVIEAVASFQ
ncbi:MAG: STAS domain-containing protein [Planctomycetes bacterium]|nr:STAS domain-containing protein [Planctomycetota bacterium]MCH9725719.1 STAS domain-containing protein [Planctomycetota bacterium]MCH9777774.1 STAS domain-containing protein [Planctomycetota bacterium]MCH9792803.1 STAS domain-containing protein [Planctomycetota bacterium]MDF1743732.1 STAS domain-containing protein [Gimesia sp.]